ncbi:MAG TPA: phosphoribosylglycinamide formyltransferase, partial [Bacteroidales bacterium]|nr:phosphoribosylglycinamide formyltransferase [Bacteroidales bacterium]
KKAETLGIPVMTFSRIDLYRNNVVLNRLTQLQPALIVLAGFMWMIPRDIIDSFPNRIINIHPALLPKYGGKGMYGSKVHEAVLAAGEKESGITIHYVNEHYDEGDVIFQERCPVLQTDTPESLAQRIHKLEHRCYPQVIGEVLSRFRPNGEQMMILPP